MKCTARQVRRCAFSPPPTNSPPPRRLTCEFVLGVSTTNIVRRMLECTKEHFSTAPETNDPHIRPMAEVPTVYCILLLVLFYSIRLFWSESVLANMNMAHINRATPSPVHTLEYPSSLPPLVCCGSSLNRRKQRYIHVYCIHPLVWCHDRCSYLSLFNINLYPLTTYSRPIKVSSMNGNHLYNHTYKEEIYGVAISFHHDIAL